jgi:hypothetical protein
MSPILLVDFLALTDPQVYEFFKTLAPDAPANIAVSWAGDETSPNWFDIAREYTEKWLHQQHMRDAVGRPGMTERPWLFPVLDTFMRAMPYTYRDMAASEGTSVVVQVEGEAGGSWTLRRVGGAWKLYAGDAPAPAASLRLDQDTAWRMFTKGISPQAGLERIHSEGARALGMPLVHMVSIVA